MIEPEDRDLIKRAEDVSHAVPFVELFQDIADEVDGWWADGIPESEIDRRILAGTHELGFDARLFWDSVPVLRDITDEQRENLIRALRFDDWTVACVRSIARTGKPTPFIYAIGDVFVDHTTLGDEGTLIWAVATEATNPETVSRKFVRKCKEVFGEHVTKEQRPKQKWTGQLTPAEAAEKKRQGMSYRDIAILNMRYDHPDVVEHPYRYKAALKAEKERLREEIATFNRLWGKRLPDSPIDD